MLRIKHWTRCSPIRMTQESSLDASANARLPLWPQRKPCPQTSPHQGESPASWVPNQRGEGGSLSEPGNKTTFQTTWTGHLSTKIPMPLLARAAFRHAGPRVALRPVWRGAQLRLAKWDVLPPSHTHTHTRFSVRQGHQSACTALAGLRPGVAPMFGAAHCCSSAKHIRVRRVTAHCSSPPTQQGLWDRLHALPLGTEHSPPSPRP